MINVAVSLYDELALDFIPKSGSNSTTADITLATRGSTTLLPESPKDNLICRAVAKLIEADLVPPGKYHFTLNKRIPIGAGLGGGSSNAATAIKLALRATQRTCAREQLCQLGLSLGSDIPFFFYLSPSRVTGLGELVAPLPASAAAAMVTRKLLLVLPRLSVPTPAVYQIKRVAPRWGIRGGNERNADAGS